MIGLRAIEKRSSKAKGENESSSKRQQRKQSYLSGKKRKERPDDIEDYMRATTSGKTKRKKNNAPPSFDIEDIMRSDGDDYRSPAEFSEENSSSSVYNSSGSEDDKYDHSNKRKRVLEQKREPITKKQKRAPRPPISTKFKKSPQQKTIYLGEYNEEEDDDYGGGGDDSSDSSSSSGIISSGSSDDNRRSLVPVSSSGKRSMITMPPPNIFADNPFDNCGDDDDDDDEEGDECEEDNETNLGGGGTTGEATEETEEVWKRTVSPFVKEADSLGPLVEGEECPGCIYINPSNARCEKNWRELNQIYIEETPWKSPKEVALQQSYFYEQRIRKGNSSIPKWSPRMIFEHNWKHVTDDSIFNLQCKMRIQGFIREFSEQGLYVTNGTSVMLDGSREVMGTLKTLNDMYQRCCKNAKEYTLQSSTSVKTVIRQSGMSNTNHFL